MTEQQNPYDITSYNSHPIKASYPQRLYTNALLFGIDAVPLENARVLEVGCASAGNLIPLAYRFPQATFVGFDYSKQQILTGLEQVATLGLTNIELINTSIDEFKQLENHATFDYILCHGVFSWVSEPIQQSLLHLCSHHLAHNGVAYISYNVYPGWSRIKPLRDFLHWKAKGLTDHGQMIAVARQALTQLSKGFQAFSQFSTPDDYAADFNKQATELLKKDDYYLIHEYFEEDNNPVYFYQFMESSKKNGLAYVCESELTNISALALPEPFATELAGITDRVDVGQHLDFIRNTRFRSSLLCKDEQVLEDNLTPIKIELLHVQLLATLKICNAEPGVEADVNNIAEYSSLSLSINDVTVSCDTRTSMTCAILLNQHRHQPIAYSELCAELQAELPFDDAVAIRQFLNNEFNLMQLALIGVIELHSDPGLYTTVIPEYPQVCPFIRYQVECGNGAITTLKHDLLYVNELESKALSLLDGTRTCQDVTLQLSGLIRTSQLPISQPLAALINRQINPADKQHEVHKAIGQMLIHLANMGCLLA